MTKIIWIVALLFSVVVSKDMDPKKLESSCDNGDMKACFSLGKLYYNGEGVKQNYQKVAELWKKACDSGISSACGALDTL
ncbi:tetratricopeptide repeat protein [Campylobacter lanienae]|uniref:tetratricopeptide repeat protein n=1 Tax=Campylobacter lanienae TaxID=75658 RepID=UPI000BB4368E|nr:SEL1-like repeat protein [Campylobacter lanienae]